MANGDLVAAPADAERGRLVRGVLLRNVENATLSSMEHSFMAAGRRVPGHSIDPRLLR